MIGLCKDRQYRYACIDSSDVIMIEDKFHKADLCNFDLYLNVWELNKSLQQ
ncbi:hypothetical protein LY11_05239 [Pedobacter cryoconitis]|uniref:Uncharacterized protein n=1 Tax=Pedobacter cryoconitis TaxID=188932 RepID=A0A327RV82_9SPHI|nr:hypothetical protein LY11_05239 [Pedobacter cryoconitis]